MQENPTVYVIDDDSVVCKGIAAVVKAMDIQVHAYESAEAFLEEYDHQYPCCVVLDVRLPGMSGLELQAELAGQPDSPPVIIITGHGDIPMAVEAVKLGAIDFLQKPFRNQVLWDNIRKALEIDSKQRKQQEELVEVRTKFEQLTPKEHEVMEHVIDGKPSKDIAKIMDISPKTVEVHRSHILEKLGVKSSVQLTRLAMKAQLV